MPRSDHRPISGRPTRKAAPPPARQARDNRPLESLGTLELIERAIAPGSPETEVAIHELARRILVTMDEKGVLDDIENALD